MDELLNKLNSEQKEAVVNTDGPSIILAGAGSGKTRVLVYKVIYLISAKNVSPQNILMVTFSNKAAGEMKNRIGKLLPKSNPEHHGVSPTVATFHSLCARILRRHGEAIGIPHNFAIYDTADQIETIKDCYDKLEISIKDIRPRAALESISSAKNQMIDEISYAKYARGYIQERVAKIYPLYQALLAERNALDFDDLINKTLGLLKESKEILEFYQDLFQYILVDEYQDTNISQYNLTKLLSKKNKNICIVGDFSQSIYSFRGADYKNLEKFKNDFPEAKIFKLSQNYRSTQIILDAAYSIISNNSSHPILKLWTNNKEGDEINILEAENEHKEAEFIVKKINSKKLDPDFSLSDVAVLYRMNAQSRTLEEVFLHYGIPYKLVGGVRFYDRKEVKDVLSYVSYISNQADDVALKRIQKLGKRRFSEFEFYRQKFNEADYINTKTTIEIIDDILKKSGYLDRYDPEDSEDRTRLENIKELRSVALEFPDLIQFLENVALVEQEYMPDGNKIQESTEAVTLMTLHAAKGLEFKIVFIVGLEEGIFPHSQSLFDYGDIEEERRLCYVGVTRAKENLYLLYAKQRVIFGQRNASTPSRFIFELPQQILEYNNIDTSMLNKEYW